jgi:hypothetical protein
LAGPRKGAVRGLRSDWNRLFDPAFPRKNHISAMTGRPPQIVPGPSSVPMGSS